MGKLLTLVPWTTVPLTAVNLVMDLSKVKELVGTGSCKEYLNPLCSLGRDLQQAFRAMD